MILIADSGSTKTDWRLIDDKGQITQFSGPGLNPYFFTEDELTAAIRKELSGKIDNASKDVQLFFYGAGCGLESNKVLLTKAFRSVIPPVKAEIETDLLGAAHALCERKPGLVAILGTGMSTCLYDGNKIVERQPSLGYVLGDEGSGAYLGKKLIQDWLNKEMPVEFASRLEERFQLTLGDVLNKVYKEHFPNRFLASFSKFIYQNLKEPYCMELVSDAFRLFFDRHILKYRQPNLPLNCTGSVAFWYSNILRGIAEEKGVLLNKVVESPIAGMALYHLPE